MPRFRIETTELLRHTVFYTVEAKSKEDAMEFIRDHGAYFDSIERDECGDDVLISFDVITVCCNAGQTKRGDISKEKP